MSKKFIDDSQMEKAHGAGIGDYIEGGVKIAVGAGLAALSTYGLATKEPLGFKNISGKRKNIISGAGLAISATLLASGVNKIIKGKRKSLFNKIFP